MKSTPMRREFSFARIEIDGSSCLPARDDKVNCAVIVKIGGEDTRPRRREPKRRPS